MNLILLKDQVIKIAMQAGAIIMQIYTSDDWEVRLKGDESPLTAADLASNQIIVEGLSQLDPHLPIISEESEIAPYEVRKNYEYFWMVDPLDGTKEFINRNGEFAINIALIYRDKPVMGVVYVPAVQEMYWAVKGGGAYQIVAGENERLKVDSFHLQESDLRIPISRSHLSEETKAVLSKLKEPRLRPAGSSLKFLMIAKALGDFYPRMGTTMEWDTAAPQIILEEAGGKIVRYGTEFKMRVRLTYNKEDLRNPDFVAMGRKLSKKAFKQEYAVGGRQ